MRLARSALLQLAVLVPLLLIVPAAGATGVRGTTLGAGNFYTSGHVILGWDDFAVGTAYDVDETDEDGRAYWIVKACYVPDGAGVPGACVREDAWPALAPFLP